MKTLIKLSELPKGSVFTHNSIPHQMPVKKCDFKTIFASDSYPKESGFVGVTICGEYFFNPDLIVTTNIDEGYNYMVDRLNDMNIEEAVISANS